MCARPLDKLEKGVDVRAAPLVADGAGLVEVDERYGASTSGGSARLPTAARGCPTARARRASSRPDWR